MSILLLSVLGILTWRQCGIYKNQETLWRATLASNPSSFMAHNNLGAVLYRRGETQAAVSEFRKVIELKPDYEIGHNDLGQALVREGLLDEAAAEFRKAIELDPAYAKAHNNLANLLFIKGRDQEALVHYQQAWKLRPASADIANNLAWLLATSPDFTLRDGPRAVEVAQRAVSLSHGAEPVFLGTLAAAFAEAGRFPEALATVRRAYDLAILRSNTGLASVLSRQMALYQSGVPFRDDKRDQAEAKPD